MSVVQSGVLNTQGWGSQSDKASYLWEVASGQVASTPALVPSATAPALAGSGTIATAGVAVARVTPAAAVASIVLAAGTVDGQMVTVQNKGAFGSSITFDVAATSNVIGGINDVVPGGSSKDYKWDAALARWVGFSSVLPVGSAAGAVATSGTITIPATAYSKITANPAGNITGVILSNGTLDGQETTIINISAFSITPAAAGTSHIADGAQAIATLTARTFIWDSTAALWYREA